MNISLPYFRNRRYLTGIDWVVGALHEAGKKTIGNGAISQAILEINGRLDDQQLRAALDEISRRFPIIHGHFSRDWFNLAPFWKVPRSARSAFIPLRVVDLPSEAFDQADQLLIDHVNTPLEFDSQHLRFLLIRLGNERSKLGLLFDHRLLDAHGAETFFRLLDETFHGQLDEIAPKIKITEPAHLDHWQRRFSSGKTLNRHLVQLQQKDVCALTMPASLGSKRIHFVHESLTLEQTAKLNMKAFEEIGVPILLPSAAARAVNALQQATKISVSGTLIGDQYLLSDKKGSGPFLSGSQYLLFTSANMRGPGEEWASIFFNHFSFVFFAALSDENKSVKEMAILLRDQFFQHIKDKIPFAMQDAAALGRIFPRSLVARVINSMFKGRMCSFYFACLKETGYPGDSFMDLPISNLTHTPLAFAPPGLNLCMTYFANRFNLVLSYLEGVMDDATARQIMQTFKDSLVNS